MGLTTAIALAIKKSKLPYSDKTRIEKIVNEPTKLLKVKMRKKVNPDPFLTPNVFRKSKKNIIEATR